MNGNDLDRYITGNWGEDSVAPEFIPAGEELAEMVTDSHDGVVIDIASPDDDKVIPATITKVTITSGMVYIETKELAWPIVIPQDDEVYFADADN